MLNQDWLKLAHQHRAIAVIRTPDLDMGYQMAKAVAAGGMRLIEITWNSDRPGDLIERLRADLPTCHIGVGTVLERKQLLQAIASGAEFCFTPHTSLDLLHLALDRGVAMIPGALTPTEIVTAWQAGAASVKVFPIQSVGGAMYIKNLQAPLGDIPLIPTGGVTPENARSFIEAGAIAVGLSGQLFPKQAIALGDWESVTRQAETLMCNLVEEEYSVNGQ
ncbi:MAG: bifunctional 4-hydroxy-2-oxoglutarate aldolase/2-dehydro-3-deoxy-phosphogluconate aldolase [Oculatellaceae cyanobacterium bins.114]|nr:bifunctional 4-hydroxy-2-oxoglutarate aldolase/2-dehydro-3-deoxy-phosphogluconate aldolase [Oculatellaceae cyanobacterium bins.114]